MVTSVKPCYRMRGAFTLIELLVVIAIIALLISILLPALGAARKAAQKSLSLSNIRQILIGNESYRGIYKGLYPIIPSYSIKRYVPPIDLSNTSIHVKAVGWCTWSGWGKNADGWWASQYFGLSGNIAPHDWEAADRQGNPFINDDPAANYAPPAKHAMGATLPATDQARKLEQFIYRDPAEKISYLRDAQGNNSISSNNFPDFSKLPEPIAMSAYDDVGTSYQWNSKWWFHTNFQTYIASAEHNFHNVFAFGAEQLRRGEVFTTSRMVLVNDQFADVIANNTNPDLRVKNSYDEFNKSMLGFVDGHATYSPVKPGGNGVAKAYRDDNHTFVFEFLKPRVK